LYSFDYKTFSVFIGNFFYKEFTKYKYNSYNLIELLQLLN